MPLFAPQMDCARAAVAETRSVTLWCRDEERAVPLRSRLRECLYRRGGGVAVLQAQRRRVPVSAVRAERVSLSR